MNDMPRILGVIPARAGSKGIVNKNIRLLAGKPLIQYTIESALLSSCLDTIVVSSDSQEILRFCKNFPEIEIPFIRPSRLSMDETPTIEVVKHALENYAERGKTFDYVCLLQPTSPFRNENLIDLAVKKLMDEKGESLVTVRKIPTQYNPHWAFKMEEGLLSPFIGDEELVPRRQELPEVWHRDGKIYLTSVNLVKQGILIGGKAIGFQNDGETDVNIDTWEDWNVAEKHLTNGH